MGIFDMLLDKEKCATCFHKYPSSEMKVVPILFIYTERIKHTALLPGYRLCSKCYEQFVAPYMIEIEKAQKSCGSITTYSINYLGNTHTSEFGQQEVEAVHCPDKDSALQELKLQAYLLGYDKIIKLKYDYETVSSGNYIYKKWTARGIAAHSG